MKTTSEPTITDPLELIACTKILAQDADESESQMLETKSDLAKRHYVRAVFAWIESLSHLFRQAALAKLLEGPLTSEMIPTLLILQEKTYALDANGSAVAARSYGKTSPMMLFSLKAFAESRGLTLSFGRGGPNWQSYEHALKIRNRITHPKVPSDVLISDADVELVREAKGMVLGYLEVVLNPKIIEIIKKGIEEAKARGEEVTIKLTGEHLKNLKESSK